MPFLQLDEKNQNLKIFYEIHGNGETKIVFIMGLWTEGEVWFRQTNFFKSKNDFQCLTFDNRGIGRSSAPISFHYSTSQMARDALALIEHLNWKNFHLVGVSMGGMIALELALLVPSRLRSLSLLVTHAGGFASRAPLVGIQQILRSLTIRDEKEMVENAMSMLYGSKTLQNESRRKIFFDYHSERVRKRIRPTLMGIVGHLMAVCRHYLTYAELLRLRYSPFPSLIFVGTEDRLVREENSYLLRKALGCRLVKFEDAGHGVQGERADELNQELLEFFEAADSHRTKSSVDPQYKNDYSTEIEAVELCCQHRTHCFVHDSFGVLKIFLIGFFVRIFISLFAIDLTMDKILLAAVLNGIRLSFFCIVRSFRARSFVRKHGLELGRAARHGGVGISLPDDKRKGIPNGSAFGFPILSLIFLINSVALIYWIKN